MKNRWHKSIVSALLCGSGLIASTALMKNSVMADGLFGPSQFQTKSERQETTFLAATQNSSFCETLGAEYQNFYSFQTRNYYISICSKGEAWFYYREAKSNPDDALLLPATVVFGGDVFKAVDKKITYFVGTNSDGYYSSVMYGNNQMIFEPELLDVPVVATQEASLTSVKVSDSEISDLPDSDISTGYWRVCTEDREDLHPYLNGWQKFIGQSPDTIGEYAAVEGHNFYYSEPELEDIAIETTDGLMVTLDVIQLTEIVGSVCVKPITSF